MSSQESATRTAGNSTGTQPTGKSSLAIASLTRYLTEGAGLGLSVVSGVIVARSLGPDGKGTFSALMVLVGVFAQTALVGMDDSEIILVGRKEASLQKATSSTFSSTVILLPFASAALWAVALLVLDPAYISESLLAIGVIPLAVFTTVLTGALNAQERVILTSLVRLGSRVVVVAILVGFVLIEPLTLRRGIAAELAAWLVAGAVLCVALRKTGVRPRLGWDLRYVVDPDRMRDAGFTYFPTGRPSIIEEP